MRTYKTILSALALLFFSFSLQAQVWELGFGVGAFNYKGDLAPAPDFRNTRPGVSIQGRYNFNYSLALRPSISFGMIKGNDATSNDPFQQTRNFAFSGTIGELSTVLEYNFFDWRKDDKNQRFTPYVFGGLGVNTLAIKLDGNAPPQDAGSFMIAIPFGIGIKQSLSKNWNLNWEFRTGKTFSDRLDAILDDNNGPKLQRVSRLDYDAYYYFGATLTYRFFKMKCPPHFQNRLVN